VGICDFCGGPVKDRPAHWRVCQDCLTKGTFVEEPNSNVDFDYALEEYEKGKSNNTQRVNVTSSITMPFGKFKGERIENINSSYLTWLTENTEIADRNPEVYKEIQNQLKARQGKGVKRGKI